MANTIRESMRGIRRGNSIRMQSGPALGTDRSARRGVMTEIEPAAPDVIGLPREIEAEIPVSESGPAENTFEWDPVTGGVDCGPRIVVYDPGDGIPRAIPDPLGIL